MLALPIAYGKLLCAMDVEIRALEDRAERLGPSTRSSSTEPMNSREELMHAEILGPKLVRSDPGSPSRAERDEHDATHLPFWSWCEHCVAGKMADLPRKRRSDRDVRVNRKTDREPMTVLNFLNCESGCALARAFGQAPR